ncbi:MAG: hypothetical protein FWC21_06475 [Treponema sp.]|nr:hypothetical protein [Treponema sp.]
MKKHIIFGVLTIFLLSFFACDHNFTIPKEVQIKGSPEIKFGAKFDLSEMFKEAIDGMKNSLKDNDDFALIDCNDTEYETFLIYMELLDEVIDLADSELGQNIPSMDPELAEILNNLGLGHNNPAAPPQTIPEGGLDLYNDTISLPLDAMDDLLSGFAFNDAKIYLYVSGSGGLAELLSIELTLPDNEKKKSDISNTNSSGYSDNWKSSGYSGEQAPGGYASEIPMSSMTSGTQEINCRIFIEGGKVITSADLALEGNILVEAVIWFPLVLTVTNSAGAKIEIMENIGEGDLFGRSSDSEESDNIDLENFVTWLKLDLVLNNKLFEDAKVLAESKGVEIIVPLTGNSITLDIKEDTLREINNPDNIPFNPSISLRFDEGTRLTIPNGFDIAITKFSISAGINAKIPLPWAMEG